MWLLTTQKNNDLSTLGRSIERFRRAYSDDIEQFMFYINACRVVVMLRDETALTLLFIAVYIVCSRI